MDSKKTKYIVKIGALSAIAFIFQLIGSFAGLKIGGFLEIEISDLPALIGAFAMGPFAGVLTELIKNIMHCTVTSTGFVGEFANFIVNGTFVLTAGIIYQKHRSRNGALAGMATAVLTMTLTAIAANLFIMLPLYMPNATFATKLDIVLSTITPFNICKGLVLSAITYLIYKRIGPLLKN